MKAPSALAAARLEELVHRHQRSVRGFLLFLGCSPSAVDDLAQETFLAVFAAGFEDQGDARAGAYLRVVARNLFLKSLRSEERRPRLLGLEEAERAWVRYEADDAGGRYLAALRRCLEGLLGRPLAVVTLRYRKNLARAAIARELGISESGVKSILVRTRERLRDCVERGLER